MKNTKINVAKIITDKIIEQLKEGSVSWQKEWSGIQAYNHVSGKPYSTLNQLFLEPGAYMTFKQVKDAKGSIKKGSKSSMVAFFSFFDKKIKEEDSLTKEVNEKVQRRAVLKYYNVFHQRDIEGIEFKDINLNDLSLNENNKIEKAQSAVDSYFYNEPCKLSIIFGSDVASYNSQTDVVQVPDMVQFNTSESYYATLFHEMTHSTGHESRLNRKLGNKFGSKDYAREELVAEIGSAMLSSYSGIDNSSVFNNTVAYINSWIKALENDYNLIIYAASKAEKAVNFILNSNINENDLVA